MSISRRLSPRLLLASGACLAEDLMDTDSREAVGSETAEIAGGTTGDRLALINRTSAGLGRVQVADLSGSSIAIPFSQNGVPTSAILPRIQQNDHILAGDVRGFGHTQLLTLETLEQ